MPIIYSAIVLDNPSEVLAKFPIAHTKLLDNHITSMFGKPYKLFGHHVTLIFGKPYKLPINGKRVSVRCIGLYENDVCTAVKVKILDKAVAKYCDKDSPHITIGCSGVKPYYSNNLIAETEGKPIDEVIEFTGTVGCFSEAGWDFDPIKTVIIHADCDLSIVMDRDASILIQQDNKIERVVKGTSATWINDRNAKNKLIKITGSWKQMHITCDGNIDYLYGVDCIVSGPGVNFIGNVKLSSLYIPRPRVSPSAAHKL